MTPLPDPVRFAVGTLTRLPVPAPSAVDAHTAGRGLLLAPLIGVGLGLASGWPLLVLDADIPARLLSATLVVALAAWLTRALHWDGLADVADGLGSGAEPERARAIMRQSDIGPFGVLTVVITLTLQVLALAQLPAGWPALAGWVTAMTLGRLALVAGSGRWVHPARADGLGAAVIGSVSLGGLLAAGLGAALVCAIAVRRSGLGGWLGGWADMVVLLVVAVGVGLGMAALARRRFGGSTGDVLGATVEAATTAALLILALT